jgi:uncharacterized protein
MICSSCLFNFQTAKYRFVLISVTNDCNNACDYCYLGCNQENVKKRITLETVREVIKGYCAYLRDFPKDERFLTIIWHGGEPLLVGIEFYRQILEIQKEYKEKYSVRFANGIETNGTLITEEWADFLKENDFFIGVSLDGSKSVHDIHRKGKNDKSSFYKSLKGINLLENKRIPFSILSVVTNKNYKFYKETLDFFLSFKNLRYADFLPGYDPEGNTEHLSPKNYGKFLESLFDYWLVKGGSTRLKIRYFEDLILKISSKITKNTPIGCEIMGRCGEIQYITEEGDLYPCVALPQKEDLRLGNFHEQSFDKMMHSRNYLNFQEKFNDIHEDCRVCALFPICKGGCAARRFYQPNKKLDGKDYYCSARKKIISKITKYYKGGE